VLRTSRIMSEIQIRYDRRVHITRYL